MGPTFLPLLGGGCFLLIILTPGLSVIHIRFLSPKTQAQTCMYTEEHIHKSTQAKNHQTSGQCWCVLLMKDLKKKISEFFRTQSTLNGRMTCD